MSSTTGTTRSQLRGIDVSRNNGKINWSLAKAGLDFAFGKASEGGDLQDDQYPANRVGAHQNGIPFASYHFVRPDDSVSIQMSNIRRAVGTFQPGDLEWLALDLEIPDDDPTAWDVMAVKDRAPYVDAFVDAFLQAYGVLPLLYMNESFFPEVLGGIAGNLGRCKLWLAAPGIKTLLVPGPWLTAGPTVVQTSFMGKWPGVPSRNVDLNVFNGTKAGLQAFMFGAATV